MVYSGVAGGTKITAPYIPTSNQTLYAHWIGEEYTLTVDPNGGKWNGSTSIQTFTGEYNSTKEIANPQEKDGFKAIFNENYGQNNTEEVYEKLAFESWTLTGSGTLTGTTFKFGTADATLTANYASHGQITAPTESREGYVLSRWNTSPDGTGSDFTGTITQDTTYYAIWEPKTITITFNPDGGQVNPISKDVIYTQAYGELPTPIKTGYEFTGWYLQNEKIEATSIVNITNNETLVAHWIGEEYTLTVDPNGGKWNGSTNIQTITRGYNSQVNIPNPEEKNGFKATFNNSYGQNHIVEVYEKLAFESWTLTGDGTLTGTTFKFGTSDATLTANYASHGQITAPTESREGYLLSRWNTSPDGTGNDFTGTITENITYYPIWEPVVYTIQYRNTKGAQNPNTITSYTVEDGNINLLDLEDIDGNEFENWTINGQVVTSIDTSRMENIIVIANWKNDPLYLISEKYKIGENDIDIYEQGDIYLNKIEPETTLAEFKNNCDTNGTIVVYGLDNHILTDDELVGTGMKLVDTRFEEKIELTLVVMGDLDSDGYITATDLSGINQAILELTTLNEVEFLAADLDDDKTISATDLSAENQTVLELITLFYIKPKKNSF